MFLCLTVEVTYLEQNRWFIDWVFTVHPDTKSQRGAYITFVKGIVDGSAKTQKINTTG